MEIGVPPNRRESVAAVCAEGTLTVPEKAITYDAKRNAFIDVPAPGTPTGKERKAVTLGVSNGTKTEIVQGLTEGQKIILQ